ncbi:MAG: glycosyltransferase family 2 protein [Gemmatimonadaceae bacterium]|nr:glycosyltransferase family 2 protein [Gemmatimonadaceae bacterium]
MRLSLLIATYNWPEALAVVLHAVRAQDVLPDEVLIADDGSGPATQELVARAQQNFPVPLHHVWHEDRGFRAGAIRNQAIARATGDYVLQIDGDIVLHRAAIAAHRRFAQRGSFVQGSRALLSESRTRELLQQGWADPGPFGAGVSHRLNAWYAPWLAPLSGGTRDTVERIRGCHIAFWRDDLLRVNGYDEAYEGWGREDSDLTLRLGHAGVVRRNLKFAAVAYHLWHRQNSRDALDRNSARLTEAARTRRVRAELGIDQYLPVAAATAPVSPSAHVTPPHSALPEL